MFLPPEEIKRQTRALWRKVFQDSEDFMDLYFEEKYTDDSNIFFRHDGQIFSAAQAFPYRFQMGGHVLPSIYISGLMTDPVYRNQGLAAQVMHYAHRRAFERGVIFSFLIPAKDQLRDFYRHNIHGNYEDATARKVVKIKPTGIDAAGIDVEEAEEYGREVFVFFQKSLRNYAVALTPSERDFFAAVADAELDGGGLVIARRKQKIVGLAVYVPAPRKTVFLRHILAESEAAQEALALYFEERFGKSRAKTYEPEKFTEKGADPYAMARVINAEKFLSIVAAHHPDEVFEIGLEGDEQIPENNGYYRLEGGKVRLIEERPNVVLLPGPFAAAFLREHPVLMPLMMDE